MQRQNGNQQGKRKGDQRNHRRTDIHQEEEEDDHHKEAPLEQTILYVIDRAVDEAALAEDIGRDMHV